MIRKLLTGSIAAATLAAGLLAAPSASAAPDRATRAEQAVRANPNQVALDGSDTLTVRDQFTDPGGTDQVRFDRTHNGAFVIGGDLVAHVASNGSLKGVSATTRQRLTVSTSPAVSRADAERTARSAAGNGATAVRDGVLQIDARTASPRLIWGVVVDGTQKDGTPSELLVLVDAQSGDVVDRHEQIETAGLDDTGFFNGAVDLTTTPISGGFSLKDPSRGNQYTVDMANKQGGQGTLFTDANDVWGDGLLSNRQTTGVDAQYGTAVTWDYYKNVQGRNGIKNDGAGAYNKVHYGRNYNNAYWSDSCFCMTYGDGDGTTYNPFDSLDVAGHEMSHGVMASTANLTYSGESGGLNEANSDMFGTAVEFYANNAKDVGDYKIGEKLYKVNPGETKALRYMYNPNLDTRSPNCYSSTIGSLDVHYSSGVANRFFFLLSEGSSTSVWGTQPALCTGNTGAVPAVTRAVAEKIWYRAITTDMTSSTNYAGARVATLNAAQHFYGIGSPNYNAVNTAWAAVGVK